MVSKDSKIPFLENSCNYRIDYFNKPMESNLSNTVQMLQQWHSGDPKGLDELLKRHLPWLEQKVRYRLGPALKRKEETLDYVQEAMVQFLRYGPRFTISNEAHFRSLLLKIVENMLRNKADLYNARRREIAKERPLPPDTVLSLDPPQGSIKTPSMSAAQHEDEAWIRLAMELLDPDDQEVLFLRKWEKLPFADIGNRQGLTEAAARMKHNRAVVKLGENVWKLRNGKIDEILKDKQ